MLNRDIIWDKRWLIFMTQRTLLKERMPGSYAPKAKILPPLFVCSSRGITTAKLKPEKILYVIMVKLLDLQYKERMFWIARKFHKIQFFTARKTAKKNQPNKKKPTMALIIQFLDFKLSFSVFLQTLSEDSHKLMTWRYFLWNKRIY